MRTVSRIAVNALSSWAATLVRAVLGLVLVPFLLARLGQVGFGLTTLAASLVAFTGFADLGLRQALVRQLAAQQAVDDREAFNGLASSAMAVHLALGSVLAAICFFAAERLALALNVPASELERAVLVLRAYGCVAIFSAFVRPTFEAALVSENRYDVLHGISTATILSSSVSLLLLLGLSDAGLEGWVGVMLLSRLLEAAALWWAAHRFVPSLRIAPSLASRAGLRPLMALSGLMFLGQVSALIGVESAPFIISAFLGPAAVARYAPAVAAAAAFRPFVRTLENQLQPLATAYEVKSDRERSQRLLVAGTRYTVLLALPSTVLLVFFAEPITRMWLEDSLGSHYQTTALVLIAWAIYDFTIYLGGTQWPLIVGSGRLRFPIAFEVVVSLLDIGLSIYLVGYTSLGVLGVIVPTVCIGLFRRPVMIVYTARIYGLPARVYLRDAYLRPAACFALLALFGLMLKSVASPTSFWGIALVAAGIGLAALPLGWWLGFQGKDRQLVGDLLRSFSRRFARN